MHPIIKNTIYVLTITLSLTALSSAQTKPTKPALLPKPQNIVWHEKNIKLHELAVKLPSNPTDELRAKQLKIELKNLFKANNIKPNKQAKQKLLFQFAEIEVPNHWDGQDKEAYSLKVSKNGKITISAETTLGHYYALQTLRQLLVHKNGKTTIPAVTIIDFPAFKIRGFMHDVGRNFQTLEQLKMQIDVMAKHKYSIFHWHLTEYHGWRLESKIYPKLNAASSHTRYLEKYYTQKEFKEMSDYCWSRGITIIPEFDSPGHSEAFRKGIDIKTMKDPKAIKAMSDLIAELCTLADKKRMPYIHIGTDEVRYRPEFVNADYLKKLHQAVHQQDREIIGWWKGMHIKGDTKQIQQTWAQYSPLKGLRHIDSRSNYVNHLEALDFATRMHFQQPCRTPHGNAQQLGGILAHWPDTKVVDEKLTLINNPVIPAIVGYSEAVWTGIKKDHNAYWAKIPPAGTPEYASYVDFENRLAAMRDGLHSKVPFPMVKTHHIQWRLLGPVADGEVKELEKGIIKNRYEQNGTPYNWTKPLHGAAIHIRHFFNFSKHLKHFPKGKNIVWANTYLYSPKDQTVDAWIGFNTISSSDDRAGAPTKGNWGTNTANNIWLNGERIEPPKWKTNSRRNGKKYKEIPLIDQVYTSRQPAKIKLKKGWNPILIKSARHFKWVFSFSPVKKSGNNYREVEGLKFSVNPQL